MPKTNRDVLIESVTKLISSFDDRHLSSVISDIIESCYDCPFKNECLYFPAFTESNDELSDKLLYDLNEVYPNFTCRDYYYSKIQES